MKKKIVSPFVNLKKSKHWSESRYPNGWVMDYAVKGCRKIIACYAHDEKSVPVFVMSRQDAKLMVKAIQKALKLNRRPVSAR